MSILDLGELDHDSTFFTSDLHAYHSNIIWYCARGYGSKQEREEEKKCLALPDGGENTNRIHERQFLFKSAEQMNSVLIERWNSVVKPSDTVIIIGDVFMGKSSLWKEFAAQLDGKIFLSYGNHDLDRKTGKIHRTIEQCGFAGIAEQIYCTINGKRIWCSHMPLQRAPDKRGFLRPKATQSYDVILGGHTHGKFVVNLLGSIDVGVDNFDFYPQKLDAILEKMAVSTPFDDTIFLPV